MHAGVMAALSSIYHLAQGIEILPREERDYTELLSRAKEYRENFIGMAELKSNQLFTDSDKLYHTWEQDTELQELVRSLDVDIDLAAELENCLRTSDTPTEPF